MLDPSLTDEEQKKILADPKGMEKLVMKELLGQPSLQLQYAYDDIKEKHEGIKKLESVCGNITAFFFLQAFTFLSFFVDIVKSVLQVF